MAGIGAFLNELAGRRNTRRHTSSAIRALRRDGRSDPPRDRTRQRVKEYSHSVFGTDRFWRWLMVYTVFRGEFVEGWIPDDFFGGYVVPNADRRHRHLARRSQARNVLDTDAVPDVAYRLDGRWFGADHRSLSDAEVERAAFADSDRAVLKREGSMQGRGIRVLRKGSFSVRDVPEGEYVIQRYIRQHDWFDRLSPSAVATLRLTTAHNPGCDEPPIVRAGYLRLATGGDEFVASRRALRVPVRVGTGRIGDYACRPDWRRIGAHPDTGFRFDGQQIPGFGAACALCEALHGRVPQLMMVGWDVAIDCRGQPEVMEWNIGHTDIKFTEAATGPHFRDLNLERFAPGP